MNNWGWDKDKHYTWYHQWDFKTPRSYKERYGVEYKTQESIQEKKQKRKEIIIAILFIILFNGVLIWMN
jgi:hypothetical protein